MDNKEVISKNFIERIIDKDLEEGTYTKVATRFPPEPNGYLHIGHAKSILLNYGLAKKYNGTFNLRFDDTNPTKEKTEFVDSIVKDVEWLGAQYDGEIKFASDYFEDMYEAAVKLIKKGKAYVCDLTAEQIKEYRGTLTEPGKNSPYRDRSIEENLDLFERMKNGEFEDGSKVLRAKIDMASPNINMRDPIIYRIARMTHHNTDDQWCIYPMYDFAHPIEDAIEHITHSICTLEFEDHRPLYDWVVQELEYPEPPKQIEFAKLYLTNVITGKRYIKRLVDQGIVDILNITSGQFPDRDTLPSVRSDDLIQVTDFSALCQRCEILFRSFKRVLVYDSASSHICHCSNIPIIARYMNGRILVCPDQNLPVCTADCTEYACSAWSLETRTGGHGLEAIFFPGCHVLKAILLCFPVVSRLHRLFTSPSNIPAVERGIFVPSSQGFTNRGPLFSGYRPKSISRSGAITPGRRCFPGRMGFF